ncbi:galactosylceramide sulfotransferase [Gadus macrocephalus]|uniref:galactosylceramide sulfotransferase n=1 Tax=Gadus macrocephalus TaxID=80720 RepID=UPI0028CB7651|nr:galactosylceramide sulfotransferase [Gadus macrocephalus]XP_059905954.1 galactosylceramide sulfotransferase [Gadus macrocephalus]
MFGTEEKKMKLIRRLSIWVVLASITMVIRYLSDSPARDNRLSVAPLSCSPNMPELGNQPGHSDSPESLFRAKECTPTRNIMFLKTHKTASSTILNILFRFGEKHQLKFAFPDSRNDFSYPSPFLCSGVKDFNPGDCFNIVCNHMRFDPREVARLLPENSVYITILRDPAVMFESSFNYYHKTIPFTYGIGGDNKVSEFLHDPWAYYSPQAYNSFYLRNLLMFDFGIDNNLEPEHPAVAGAIRRLSDRFRLVLIAEHFEESLVLLKEALCWTTEDLVFFQLNARRRSSVSRLTPRLRAKALAWNGADWRLYLHFNATLWARVAVYGEERMEREVKELRDMNAKLRAICIEGGEAVEAAEIQDRGLLPWQPVGEESILGYNMRTNLEPKYRELCRKMLTPEIQYLSDLGVNLWLTRLWGWIKDWIPVIVGN